MDPKLVKALLDALVADDPEAIKAAATALLAGVAAPSEAAEAAPAADPALDALAADPEPAPVKLAALTAIRDLTGVTGLAEAVALLSAWRAERDAADIRAATFEDASRFGLVGELVKLGAETPATAWIGEGKDRKLVARLSTEAIGDLRSRVNALKTANPGAAQRQVSAPAAAAVTGKTVSTSHGVVTLSASEIANIEESGADLDAYARNKAIREAARAKKAQ